MAMDRATLEGYLREAFPDAVIALKDLAGDNDHWSAEIVSETVPRQVARGAAPDGLRRAEGPHGRRAARPRPHHARAGLTGGSRWRERTRDNAIGVRRLGFGVSGPHGTPLVRPERRCRLIQHAFAMGVRVFDTGPSYGNGEAERRLGEALRGCRPMTASSRPRRACRHPGVARRVRDFSPDGVRRSVEASLKRLRRTRIDWLFLHGPAPARADGRTAQDAGGPEVQGRHRRAGHRRSRAGAGCGAAATGQFSLFMAPVHAGLKPDGARAAGAAQGGGRADRHRDAGAGQAALPGAGDAGATWRLARALLGRVGPAPPTPMTVEEALQLGADRGRRPPDHHDHDPARNTSKPTSMR